MHSVISASLSHVICIGSSYEVNNELLIVKLCKRAMLPEITAVKILLWLVTVRWSLDRILSAAACG